MRKGNKTRNPSKAYFLIFKKHLQNQKTEIFIFCWFTTNPIKD